MIDPKEAPAPEEQGYSARAGFVKGNPLNNDFYVEQFAGDEWEAPIREAHALLTEKFPGYNIAQIKDKFGGLRFYINQGNCPDDVWDSERAHAIAHDAEHKAWEISNPVMAEQAKGRITRKGGPR